VGGRLFGSNLCAPAPLREFLPVCGMLRITVRHSRNEMGLQGKSPGVHTLIDGAAWNCRSAVAIGCLRL